MAEQARKRGKKNRKHGRNKKSCEQYRKTGQREKNKARKHARHLKRLARKANNAGPAMDPSFYPPGPCTSFVSRSTCTRMRLHSSPSTTVVR